MPDKKHPLRVKDHAVSAEEFELRFNQEYQWLETHPRPSEDQIHRYYESPDYISHTDSKRNLFEKAYQFVKRINLRRKFSLVRNLHPNPGVLLDVGCGTGDFLEYCQSRNWIISGLEPNKTAREIALSKTGIKIHDQSEWDKLERNKFDCISLWHVLEHLYSPKEELKRYSKMLKEGSAIIIAVPNFNSFDASYYKSDWAAYDVPRHLWHFSRQSIDVLARENQLQVESVHPMLFDAYYVSLLSEKYKSGWMNLFSAFFIATRSNLKARTSGEYSSLIYVLKRA